jgi:hypothetical protein
MREPKYGTMKKKIIFYDSDKRYADFKIRLKHDNISQPQFFRGIMSAYLKNDKDFRVVIDKIKKSKRINHNKEDISSKAELINEGQEVFDKIILDEEELTNIFDMLENENFKE